MKTPLQHASSLFLRLTSLFEQTEDKLDAAIQCCKMHRFNYNRAGASTGNNVAFDIDADATHPVYVEFSTYCDVVPNAGTTNVLTLGTTAGNATDVFNPVTITLGGTTTPIVRKYTARTKIYYKYTQTGTPATAGQVTFFAVVKNCFNW